VKFEDFRAMILNTLKADEDSTYSDELIHEATCLAIDAILPWIPKAALTTITADGLLDRFPLPADCYAIEAIQDVTTGTFVEKDLIQPGKMRNSAQGDRNLFTWLEFPRGSLYLSKVLDQGREIRVYYTAYFNKPSTKDDLDFELETPRYALAGMLYWACAHCVIPFSTSAAQVRNWNQKIDSGKPTDNPLEANARFYRQLFIDEMTRVPKVVGGIR
jgi:hypothetical protein